MTWCAFQDNPGKTVTASSVLMAKEFGIEDVIGKVDDSRTGADNTWQSGETSKSCGVTEDCSDTTVVSSTLEVPVVEVLAETAVSSTIVFSSVDRLRESRGASTEEPGSIEYWQGKGFAVGVYSGGGSSGTHDWFWAKLEFTIPSGYNSA